MLRVLPVSFPAADVSPALVVALVIVVVCSALAVVVAVRIARRLRAIGDEGQTPDERNQPRRPDDQDVNAEECTSSDKGCESR